MRGIGEIIGVGGGTGIAYLGLLLLVLECVTIVSGYIWCRICNDTEQNNN